MAAKLPYPAGTAREAIVYVPGLAQEGDEESAEVITHRLAVALQDDSPDKKVPFTVEKGANKETYGGEKGYRTAVCAIRRPGAGGSGALIDVYRMEYSDTLTKGFEQSSLFWQCFVVLGTLVRLFPKFVAVFFRRHSGTSYRQKLQLLIAAFWLGLVCVYAVLLIGTAVQALIDLAPGGRDWINDHLFGWSGAWKEWLANLPRALVLLMTVGLTFVPALRAQLTRSAMILVSLARYLDAGVGRLVLIEQLKLLLQLVRGKGYDRVHIVAYSMGSVIALDCLFPFEDAGAHACDGIDTLVTIGCPFDVVRTYWRDYYTGRNVAAGNPRRWVNVYSPSDILGSNFRDDEQEGPATAGIAPRVAGAPSPRPDADGNVAYHTGQSLSAASLWEVVNFVGFRSHGAYWDKVGGADLTCFSDVVPAMYDDTPPAAAGS